MVQIFVLLVDSNEKNCFCHTLLGYPPGCGALYVRARVKFAVKNDRLASS